jgi:excisionase family DNA binding protein
MIMPRQVPALSLDAIIEQIADRVVDKLEKRMSHKQSERELLTVKETAQRIGRSTGAVHQLIARGEMPCVRHGRRIHVRMRELQNWIDCDAA